MWETPRVLMANSSRVVKVVRLFSDELNAWCSIQWTPNRALFSSVFSKFPRAAQSCRHRVDINARKRHIRPSQRSDPRGSRCRRHSLGGLCEYNRSGANPCLPGAPHEHTLRARARAGTSKRGIQTLIRSPTRDRRSQVGLQGSAFAKFKEAVADRDKKTANARAGALRGLRAIVEKCGQPAESLVLPFLGALIELLADKVKPVAVEAEKLQEALFSNISAHAVMVRTLVLSRSSCILTPFGRAHAPHALCGECGEALMGADTPCDGGWATPLLICPRFARDGRRRSCLTSSKTMRASGSPTWAARRCSAFARRSTRRRSTA